VRLASLLVAVGGLARGCAGLQRAVWCLAFYATGGQWAGCWRLAAAALLPGSILLAGDMLYSLHRLNLIGVLAGGLPCWWLGYCGAAPCAPRRPGARPARHPFATDAGHGAGCAARDRGG